MFINFTSCLCQQDTLLYHLHSLWFSGFAFWMGRKWLVLAEQKVIFFFLGCIQRPVCQYKDGHIILLCRLVELPWLKPFIVFIGLNNFIWLNHWDFLRVEIVIVYSYLTAVVCLGMFLVLTFLFLALLKETKNLIFGGVVWPLNACCSEMELSVVFPLRFSLGKKSLWKQLLFSALLGIIPMWFFSKLKFHQFQTTCRWYVVPEKGLF